ncbi:MAG: prepilin-type N-terminal cleavage/methylation domain-containing protein [Kiritimatiellae bacterium]|nr:prepilin-type N-terminal cleavage/methylation domain-containing protein [Kiritimatiellia bacterium]
MRRGFTLIELLVVIGMIAVLMGSIGSGMNQARRRAMIAKATQDAKEMTNAILAFENYAKGHSLANYATGSWRDTTEGSMSMILGGEQSDSGEEVPVLYNAHIRNGQILDPWGNPYQYLIRQAGSISPPRESGFQTAPSLPNFYRLGDEERE